jgi:hypothetical protein
MDEQQHAFTVQEDAELRKEMMDYVAETRRLEVYAVVPTALMYSFLISLETGRRPQPGSDPGAPVWAWAVPVAFPVLSLMRGFAFYSQMVLLAEYLRQIEVRYGRNPPGWEHFIDDARRAGRSSLGRTSTNFALVLLGFTVVVFLLRLLRAAA